MKLLKRCNPHPSSRPEIQLDCDEALHLMRGTGLWQLINFLLLCFPSMASGFLVLSYVYTGFKPAKYRCSISECDNDDSPFKIENAHTTLEVDSDIFVRDSSGAVNFCETRPLNTTIIHQPGKCTINSFNMTGDPVVCNAKHTHVLFDELPMKSTIVTEFNLFCNEEYKIAMVGSIYMVGMFFGGIMIGRFCDLFGRRFGTALSICIGTLSHFGAGWCSDYYSYVVARFIAGVGGMGCLNASFTLVVELVEGKHRRLASMGLMIAFSLGEAFVGIFAIYLRDWREFHIFTSIPLFVMIPIYFVLAESPRWLNRKQKYKELYSLFRVMAKMNSSKLPLELEQKLQEAIILEINNKGVPNKNEDIDLEQDAAPKTDINVKPSQLALDSTLRIYTTVMFANWALVTLGYYGISMVSVKIGSNAYISQILAALMGIPSYVFCIFLMDIWGRKPICCFGSILCGIVSIAAGFNDGTAQLILTLIGKFGSTAVFGLLYLYTAELYPTEIRGTALGLCCMMSRFGGFSAPQVTLLLTKDLAMLVLGSCSLVAGLLTLALPETLGTLLVEHIEEVHELKQDGKPFLSCWSESTLKNHLETITYRKKGTSLENEQLQHSAD